MLLLPSLLVLLSVSDTFVSANKAPLFAIRGAKPRSAASDSSIVSRQPDILAKRTCPPGTTYLYANPGTTAEFCIGSWVLASCVVLVTGFSAVFTALSVTTGNWVKASVTDASSAGPQTKRDEDEPLTWGALYNATVAIGSNIVEGDAAYALVSNASASQIADLASIAGPFALDPSSEKNIVATSDGTPYFATRMEIHEDGFSASFAPDISASGLEKRSDCYEQVHIHYWAAAGQTDTILDLGSIEELTLAALNNSYQANYAAVCYELDNAGSWHGWYRVCYNDNLSQVGCFTCNGYNN